MKKFLLTLPIALAALFAVTTAAQAETNIVATINHDFVAGGKAHSAGTYKVYRLSSESLLLRSQENGETVFLMPTMHAEALPGQVESVKLTLSGGVYYLSEVATDVSVYSLPLPQVATESHRESIAQSKAGKE